MSADAAAPAPANPDEVEELSENVAVLDSMIEQAISKIESGRIRDAEKERARVKWYRVTKDLLAEKRKTLESRKLEELQRDVAALKEADDP